MNKEKVLNILIGIVVLASAVLGYFYIYMSGEEIVETPGAPTGGELVLVNGRILSQELVASLITTLSRITLDRTHIDSEGFKSLRDITIPLVPEPVGVKMPFGKL